jgi:hypothetical protein
LRLIATDLACIRPLTPCLTPSGETRSSPLTVSPISENEGARIGATDGHHQSGPSRFSPLAMQSK